MRLDLYLVEKGYFKTRQKAKYAILDNCIFLNKKCQNKPSFEVKDNDLIEIINNKQVYVSRGGYKLEKAIKEFNLDINNKDCLDIGASTGGFTDCLIKNNANVVYAIDVGTNQLDESLKNNNKVISKENVNFRYILKENVDNLSFDVITVDVSFISLEHIFSNAFNLLKDNGLIVCLIKPQFELFDVSTKTHGYISKAEDHINAINNVISYDCKDKNGTAPQTESPYSG